VVEVRAQEEERRGLGPHDAMLAAREGEMERARAVYAIVETHFTREHHAELFVAMAVWRQLRAGLHAQEKQIVHLLAIKR